MFKMYIRGVILLSVLSIGVVAESKTMAFIGPGFGWWGHPRFSVSGRIDSGRFFIGAGIPFWRGHSGFNLFFSRRIDGRLFFNASLPLWWDYDYSGYYPYRDYNSYYNYRDYGKVILNNPEPVEDSYGKGSYAPNVTEKEQDRIFYGGIQIHPAGRIKITTTKDISGKTEVANIEIDGFPAGKTGTEEKPFEMGLLIGKHTVTLKKDGKEVFSTEVDIERNKEISLKIDLEGLN